ncbi:hypothetical protein [Bacillus sp. FJAT-22090]|uniref:hypothetical protein n=1 Tax=Bacillus sp. FJAT-22090 TaxID=1581038 RepID=UPI001643558E|nr:hypothetical protein [Bacillus sp. FJAT-22090]
MSQYLYILKNDLKRLGSGESVYVFVEPEGKESGYVMIESKLLELTFKVDNNKYQAIKKRNNEC